MLKWLVASSIRLRPIVVALAILLLFVGYQELPNTALDVFPEFAPPQIEIQTEAPGLSTPEVESLVTVPLENSLRGIEGIQTLRSKSVLGLSSVVMILASGADSLGVRQLVQERLATLVGDLPEVANPPVILPPLSATSRVLKIGLSSAVLDQMDLSTLARWTIRPRLMAISGVANVAIWGQRDQQLQVTIDPERLHANQITVPEVTEAVRQAVIQSAGGYIDTPNQRLALSLLPPVRGIEDLSKIPVKVGDGLPLLLEDVAEIGEGFPPPIGDAIINDSPAILLIVEKHPSGNTLQVTREVEAALDELRPGLGDVDIDSTIFRPATFIEMSLENLSQAFWIGAILVVGILILFLFEWRTALISLLAIPVSLLAAAMTFHYVGATINTMVLAGLIIALGEVVDDAIIDVENIVRRLQLNRLKENPEPPSRVILDASLEVRSAIVYATMIIVLVFLPVFFLPGLSGSFFRPLALSYILAVVASLLVALTLTPALARLLLVRSRESRTSPVVRILKRGYGAVLPALLTRARSVAGVLGLILIATAISTLYLAEEFLPSFKEYDFLMHWLGKPATSLEAMRRTTMLVSAELRSVPGVRNFGSHIGRAEVADEVVGPEFAELWISLDPSVDYDATVQELQEVVDGYPGVFSDLLTYLKERVKEVLTGAPATIVIRTYGPELAELRRLAGQIGAVISDISGVVDLKVEPQVLVPMIEMEYRHDQARHFGITPGQVRRVATTLVRGEKVGEIYRQQQILDVVVRGSDAFRSSAHALRQARISTPGGEVPFGDLIDFRVVPAPNSIQREGGSRRIDVSLNVRGSDLGSVARAVEERVSKLEFPRGYYPEVIGEYAERQAARQRLYQLAIFSLIAILLLLHVDFRSMRLVMVVFLSLPFALVGGVTATFASGGILSLGSLVGLVTVLGIASRNGIMMVSHFRHLEMVEGMSFGIDLILRGAQERLAPILMTATTTALALLPIALGGGKPGYEIEHPMAIVILGGLITSTLLTLLALPALYLLVGKSRPPGPYWEAS